MYSKLKKFIIKHKHIFFIRDKKSNNKKKLLIFILRIPLFIPALIFFVFIKLLYSIFRIKIRIGLLRADKLGHLSLENELYFCEKLKNRNKNFIDIFFNDGFVCNNYLFNLIKSKVYFFPNYFLRELYILFFFFSRKKNIANRFYEAEDYENLIDNFPQQIIINKNLLKKDLKILKKIGLKYKQRIVCLHIRDELYGGKNTFNNHRNILNVNNYKKAIKYLIKKKYFVIRVGRLQKSKILYENRNFLDYPFSKIKSDTMDLFLAYNCDFCISTGSGFDALTRVFRKPVLYTNFASYGDTAFGESHMIIYKKFLDTKGKAMSIHDLWEKNLFQIDNFQNIIHKEIKIVENSSTEILKATQDFLKYKKNKKSLNKHMIIKNKLNIYFKKNDIIKLNCNNNSKRATICPSFIKKIII